MKPLPVLVISVLIVQNLPAQPYLYPQLRLKTGLGISFPSSGNGGYAYKTGPGISGSIVLGGEFSHPFKNKRSAWHVGFAFQDGNSHMAPNEKNLVPVNLAGSPYNFQYTSVPAKTVIYAGYEKFLGRDFGKPNKNYFSIVAGLGFAFTLNKFTDWNYSASEKYQTRNGGIVEGYTSDITKPAFPVSPSLYAGIRYTVTNKKGIPVLLIELLGSYGLTSYYRQTVNYTLDGMPRQDVLRDKGFCVQLNIIVPLYSFGKKARGR